MVLKRNVVLPNAHPCEGTARIYADGSRQLLHDSSPREGHPAPVEAVLFAEARQPEVTSMDIGPRRHNRDRYSCHDRQQPANDHDEVRRGQANHVARHMGLDTDSTLAATRQLFYVLT